MTLLDLNENQFFANSIVGVSGCNGQKGIVNSYCTIQDDPYKAQIF